MTKDNLSSFANPADVTSYADSTLRKVPGLADVHRMAMLLLSERAQEKAHILVVGAGGGLELKAMAQAQPDWRFTGVDPSRAMLDLARQAISPVADRVDLVTGTVDEAPLGPFDGATCLLTLHFLDRSERMQTLRDIRCRLKPGAALIVVHHASLGDVREHWLARSAVFADHSGFDRQRAMASAKTMAERLFLLSPAEEEAMLHEAGFSDIALFYAALSFRGWVAIAGPS